MTRSGERLRIEVLGPLRVLDGGSHDITPAGLLQRRLLALLVLRQGRVVSVATAVAVLWPRKEPDDAVAALQNHLFRLRRSLPSDVIGSVDDGYRLDPSSIELDAELLGEVLAEDPSARLGEIDALLERWTGPPYPELDDVDEALPERMRLEELRTRAQEIRIEVKLARGETDGLVAELTGLSEADPLRERPRALLMTVQAATGRQAEALRVYDDFRRLLGDELGIDPSPALAAQHRDLLAGTLVSGWVPASRLPVPATSLVGREGLLTEVTALANEARLVSLIGPGGVGKTRLAIEAGHRLLVEYPDRPVVLCELATAGADSVVEVVAAALGIDARPGTPLSERLLGLMSERTAVLLLDNCEHVLESAAELVESLLARCPDVRIVATSRERIRVAGEQVRQVPTLPFGDEDASAVLLFIERARALVPGFEPDTSQLACITEIVRRLDGLPLAIELAAARMHTHDVEEIAAGLDQRFALLSSGYRTSTRHGSLSAAVSWSFGLLDQELQDTFLTVSVFSGSFDIEDAAALCGQDSVRVAAALAQLVERSLVLRAPRRRFLLLETLRAYGAEQLEHVGRYDEVAERHAQYESDRVIGADLRLVEPGTQSLIEVDAAVPELRSALAWLLDHEQIDAAGRLIAGLLDYGILRLRPDVLAWSERVAAADPEDHSAWASLVWVTAAYSAWMDGDVAETGVRSARALRIAVRDGVTPPEVLTMQGSHALFEGRLEEAAEWYERSADLAAGSDPAQRLMAVSSRVLALAYAGDPAATEEADALLAEIGDAPTPHAAYTWYCAGEADLAHDVERARARFAHALHLADLTGAAFVVGLAASSLASIDSRLGDPEVAAQAYRRLILDYRRAGMWSTQWTMLRSVAGLLARLGRYRDAAVMEGAVRETTAGHRIFGSDEVALGELSTALRHELGAADYEAARAQGSELDGAAAVEFALRVL